MDYVDEETTRVYRAMSIRFHGNILASAGPSERRTIKNTAHFMPVTILFSALITMRAHRYASLII